MRANFVMSGIAAGLRRNAAMTIALVLSTAIALGFVGAAILANTEITKFRQTYEDKINVSIYLCATQPQDPCKLPTNPAQTAAIAADLRADPMVKSFSYISEERQYELGKAQQPAVAKYLQPGVLPASFSVNLHDLKNDYPKFAAKYQGLPGVGRVQNQIDTINTLLNIIDSARWFSIVIALVVLIASVLLMANTIQVAASQRRNETSIMRLVGASRWMTELPFVLEVVIATVIGGLVATVGIWVGERYVLNGVFAGPTRNGVIPTLTTNEVLIAGGAGLLVGIAMAAFTAFATLRLYVRL
jgi:cell division transport system permease protein